MKRLSVILIVLLVLSLSACDNSSFNSKSNVISASDLNKREDIILATTSEHSFVFDYNIDAEYKEMAVWIEKYVSGELIDDKIGYMTKQIDDDSGTIILATSKTSDDKKMKEIYHIGMGDKSGIASTVVTDDVSKNAGALSMVFGQLTDKKALNVGKANVLATIAYSDNKFGISSVSNNFYEDPDAHMDELNKYNVVYLFKVELMK